MYLFDKTSTKVTLKFLCRVSGFDFENMRNKLQDVVSKKE